MEGRGGGGVLALNFTVSLLLASRQGHSWEFTTSLLQWYENEQVSKWDLLLGKRRMHVTFSDMVVPENILEALRVQKVHWGFLSLGVDVPFCGLFVSLTDGHQTPGIFWSLCSVKVLLWLTWRDLSLLRKHCYRNLDLVSQFQMKTWNYVMSKSQMVFLKKEIAGQYGRHLGNSSGFQIQFSLGQLKLICSITSHLILGFLPWLKWITGPLKWAETSRIVSVGEENTCTSDHSQSGRARIAPSVWLNR